MGIKNLMSLLVIFVFTAMITSACRDGTSQKTTGSDSEISVQKSSEDFGGIRFEIQAPFSIAILKISPDGDCSYEANSPKTGIEKQISTKELTKDEVVLLVKVIQDTEFFALKESYQPEFLIADVSVYLISVTINGKTKQVRSHGYDDCPEEFKKVMQTIKSIWGKDILEVGV